MANVFVEESSLTAIGDTLREYDEPGFRYRPDEMADGIRAAISRQGNQAYYEGRRQEYDAFWDAYQKKGGRKNYDMAFAGEGWTAATFCPKYPLNPTHGYMLFRNSSIEADLVEIMEESTGLPWSKCFSIAGTATAQFMFNGAKFTRIGAVDFSSVSDAHHSWFTNCNRLTTIDKITFKRNTTRDYQICFDGCTALQHITVEPETIATNGLSFEDCELLTVPSLVSIIGGLVDHSADTSGTDWLLTLGATNLAKLTDAQKQVATARGWRLA